MNSERFFHVQVARDTKSLPEQSYGTMFRKPLMSRMT